MALPDVKAAEPIVSQSVKTNLYFSKVSLFKQVKYYLFITFPPNPTSKDLSLPFNAYVHQRHTSLLLNVPLKKITIKLWVIKAPSSPSAISRPLWASKRWKLGAIQSSWSAAGSRHNTTLQPDTRPELMQNGTCLGLLTISCRYCKVCGGGWRGD